MQSMFARSHNYLLDFPSVFVSLWLSIALSPGHDMTDLLGSYF